MQSIRDALTASTKSFTKTLMIEYFLTKVVDLQKITNLKKDSVIRENFSEQVSL